MRSVGRSSRCWGVALGALMVTASLPTLVASPASATPVCSGSVAPGTTYTCTPQGAGSIPITVPAGVDSINITADGGGGGKNASLGNGGSGARVNATFPVTPGTVLTVYVGSGGGAGSGGAGNVGGTGYGAGGNGGPFYEGGFGGGYGGGGGGSSAVLIGGAVAVVAGGGGGGGNYYGGSSGGGNGGTTSTAGAGGDGGGACAVGGGGGNSNGSGSAGSTSGTGNPTSSSAGYAGRGGGGIFGAGGASSGGGGGGAGYGGGGAGNWNGPQNSCTLAGGGGAGGSYASVSATFGSAGNAGMSGAGGDGQVAIHFYAAPATRPGAPTDLVFSGVTTTDMTVYWTAPVSDGGSTLLGYDVVVDGGTPVRVSNPAYSMTGLTPGHTYALAITSVNAVGSSLTALTGSQMTVPPGTPTAAATNLVFSGITSTSITASWTPPIDDTAWPILGYQVRVDGGTLTWTPVASFTVGGLGPATSHSFEIKVVNGAGASPALTGTQSTTATLPDPPTSLSFSGVTSTSITATWFAPAYDGGAAVTAYDVTVDGGAPVRVGSTTYTANGLTSSAWHSFSITAVNPMGSSSALTGSRSTAAPPGSPMITATSVAVGSPSSLTLTDFPASSTQTVVITAPNQSMATITVNVDGSGNGTGTYTPTAAGSYSLVTSPTATSTTFIATSAPGPGPGPGPGPDAPSIAPATQSLTGVVGTPVVATPAFTVSHFTLVPTFTISPALPTGLSIDSRTGVVSGTPTVVRASTLYVITATAGTEVATSSLRLTIEATPTPTASILIVGRAGKGKEAGRIFVAGTSTGLVGSSVQAHVRLLGQRNYSLSGTRVVAANGTFAWQRRASKRAYVYFTAEGGIRSNRVSIPPAR